MAGAKVIEELKKIYPEGSEEFEILKFSLEKQKQEQVPPMLVSAFKILMWMAGIMAAVSFLSVAIFK